MENNNKTKIDWNSLSMQMIVLAGEAKSLAMEALHLSKQKEKDQAFEKIKLAEKTIGEASHLHFEVIQQEAQGIEHPFRVIFLHAEDQLLTTQTLILLVKELIEINLRS